MTVAFRGLGSLIVGIAIALPTPLSAQPESKSAALALELAQLLDAQKIDSVAARRGSGDEFVGALYFPGSQLLVVNARFSAPDRLTYHLLRKAYRDVYIELNSASEKQAKVFVSDLGANGLAFRRRGNQPFDTVEISGRTVAFDGEWRKAKLSEDEYTKTFQTSDAQYSEMLQALIAELKKPS